MLPEAVLVTAARAFCHIASAAIDPNKGKALDHFRSERRFNISFMGTSDATDRWVRAASRCSHRNARSSLADLSLSGPGLRKSIPCSVFLSEYDGKQGSRCRHPRD